MKKVDLSIIIVNYKVDEKTLSCIGSIYDSKPKLNFEIIVVDNSEKPTLKTKLKNQFPKVKYIKSERNVGYGAGNNIGVNNSAGEYLFILNPDTRLVSGKIESLVSLVKKNKKTGIVAPVLVKENNIPYELQGTKELTPKRAIFSLSILSKAFPKNKIYKDYYNTSWNKKNTKEVENVPGTAFVIRKDLFNEVGGFDEKFFLFFEEFDLCRRVMKTGFKNYITPEVKIYHEWGASTKLNKNTEKYFQESRFYYFKKNYGLLNAIITEAILGINKYSVILGIFLVIGFFLRTFKLSSLMTFIADQGLFYLPARDMLVYKIIPLVGPETSHPWIHHGPLWIYTLAVLLGIFKFDPVPPAYFIAVLGTITIGILYIVTRNMFDRKIALLSAIIFATSPLIVLNSRIPYHTSPIPFFVIILFYLTYKLVGGRVWVFPLITFMLGVLYNHEITNFVYFITIGIIFIYGLIKKRDWYKDLLNLKIILVSILSFSIPMLPFYIYDTSHGYKQTLGFMIWVAYRIVKFPLSLIDPRFKSSGSSPSTIPQFFEIYKNLIFTPNTLFVALFLILTTVFVIVYFSRVISFDKKKIFKFENIPTSHALLFIFLGLSFLGIAIHRVPIDADLLLFSPFVVILSSMAIIWLFRNKFNLALIFVIVIGLINSYFLLSTDFLVNINGVKKVTLTEQLKASDQIISLSQGKPYNLLGRGALSDFKSFTMPYEYLTWWKGHAPQKENTSLKIVIWQDGNKLIVYKKK